MDQCAVTAAASRWGRAEVTSLRPSPPRPPNGARHRTTGPQDREREKDTTGPVESASGAYALIDQLVQGGECIDHQDLLCLARVHGLCEALTGATSPQGRSPDEVILKAAADAARLLEALVLSDAQSRQLAVASVIDAVNTRSRKRSPFSGM